MNEKNAVRGYKVFEKDWTCRGKQYACPGMFEEDAELSICERGMHFCRNAADCFDYYKFTPENKVAEVIAHGAVVEYGDKCCSDRLEIVREIPWGELLELVNAGKWCAGIRNSGDWNKCDFSNGCFNTVSPKIHLFNRPSEWCYSDWLASEACRLMLQLPGDWLAWVPLADMTYVERAAHPEAETTCGFLRRNEADREAWWRGLSDDEKAAIMGIPNFDRGIFKEVTGIDVGEAVEE